LSSQRSAAHRKGHVSRGYAAPRKPNDYRPPVSNPAALLRLALRGLLLRLLRWQVQHMRSSRGAHPATMDRKHGRCLVALVTHVLLRAIACRMEQGLLVIEHRAEIAHVRACRDKR